jgi:perosamine synthetase
MTAGEGGMVVTDDEDLALKLRRYSGLGYGSIGIKKGRITKDDIQDPEYERHTILGWNYRPTDLMGAVALAQLERLDELVEMRKIAAEHFLKAIDGCSWLTPQKVNDGDEHTYWAFPVVLDTDKVEWHTFRKKFMEMGGDGIYAAWKLSYTEPAYRDMSFLGREELIRKYGEYDYSKVVCPNAEYLQPRMLQFKTDYWDEADAIRQADILKATIDYFESVKMGE